MQAWNRSTVIHNVWELCETRKKMKKLNVMSVSERVVTESWRTEIINLM